MSEIAQYYVEGEIFGRVSMISRQARGLLDEEGLGSTPEKFCVHICTHAHILQWTRVSKIYTHPQSTIGQVSIFINNAFLAFYKPVWRPAVHPGDNSKAV